MIPLNYHHLYYFWSVARAGSIAAAARELYLSQPTLSLQLQQLEKALGHRLLERGRAGVRLTDAGRTALDSCERIFSEGAELLGTLKSPKAGEAPVLRLGFSQELSREIFLRVLDLFTGGQGRPRVTLLSGPAEALRERLERHALDAAVCHLDLSSELGPDFRCRRAARVPIHFVAAPALARKTRPFPRGLAGAPMLLRTAGNPVRRDVDRLLARRGIVASVVAEIEDVELMRILALRGRGVAVLDALSVREELKGGRLVRLDRGPAVLWQEVYLIAARQPKANPALREAIEEFMGRFTLRLG